MTLLMFGLIAATPSLCLVLRLIGPERRPSFNAFPRPVDRESFNAPRRPAAPGGFSAFSVNPGAIACGGGFDAGGCGGDGGGSC